MGCCLKRTNDGQFEVDKKLTRELRSEARERQKVRSVRLLLLGAGESGKSTIAKQMKILYLNGYTEEEKRNIIPSIHANLLSAMKDILKGVQRFGFELSPQAKTVAQTIGSTAASVPLTKDIADMLRLLYNDPEVQKVLSKNNEFQMYDHLDFMMGRLDELIKPNYIPSVEDILKVRVRTTGIMEMSYQIDQIHFTIMDMGGQRSERRKWIFFFEGVTAVIFVLALNEYDLPLREDPKVNRMQESLDLFKKIINHQCFQNTPIIFFLNKTDLFREKILRSDLRQCFPEYTGGPDYNNALKFITDKFVDMNVNKDRVIFTHQTCATDTDNLRRVMDDVRLALMQDVLQKIGIL